MKIGIFAGVFSYFTEYRGGARRLLRSGYFDYRISNASDNCYQPFFDDYVHFGKSSFEESFLHPVGW